MFVIKADGQELYNPALFDEQYMVISPELRMEVNKAGSLSFTMPPCNALWGSLNKLTSIITVEHDGNEVFRGRVMNDETDTYKQRSVYCEGELAYLLDSISRPYEFSGSAIGLFRRMIETHNECVEEAKQFTVGRITAVNAYTEAEVKTDEYSDTMSEINTRILGAYGGYIRVRMEDGVRYIDYLSKAGEDNTQPIQLGVNLLDMKESISAEDVFTVLIPTGAMQRGSNGRYTESLKISSVNDGKDYLEDAEGIAKHGRIWRTKHWDYIEDAEKLKEKGLAYLQTGIAEDATLTITAVDMHFVDPAKQRIWIGDMVRIVSDPHGIDRVTICTKIVMPLQEPDKAEYTFGEPKKTLTDNVVKVDEKTGGGGGGGRKTPEEEIKDVLRWAYAQADQDKATFDILTGEQDNINKTLTQANIRLDGVEGSIELMASKESVDELGNVVESEVTRIDQTYDHILQQVLQNGEVMTEINQTVDGIDAWSKDTEGNLADLLVTANAIKGQVSDVEGNVGTLMLSSDEFRTTLQNGDTVLSQIRQLQDEISQTVNDANGTIGALTVKADSITGKITSADNRISQLQVKTDGLTYTLEQNSETLALFDVNQQHMLTQIGSAASSIGILEVTANAITQKVEDVNKGVGQFQVTADRISGSVTALDGRVGSLELRSNSFDVAIGNDGLGGKINMIEGLLDLRVEGGGNTVSVRLNAMDDSIDLKASKTYVDNLVANYVTTEQLQAQFATFEDSFSEYIGTTQLDATRVNTTNLDVDGSGYIYGLECNNLTVNGNGASWKSKRFVTAVTVLPTYKQLADGTFVVTGVTPSLTHETITYLG